MTNTQLNILIALVSVAGLYIAWRTYQQDQLDLAARSNEDRIQENIRNSREGYPYGPYQ